MQFIYIHIHIHMYITSGLCVQDIVRWRFDGSVEQYKTSQKQSRHSMNALWSLDNIDETKDELAATQFDEAADNVDGELISAWAIRANADSEPQFLPTWWRLPIEKALATWQREGDRFAEKHRSRTQQGHRGLTKTQQEAHDAWKADPVRRLVLDKKNQIQLPRSEIPELRRCSTKRRKDFLVVEIYMAEEAEKLSIRSGSGPWYRLQLLRGATPTAAVPAAMDVMPGIAISSARERNCMCVLLWCL